MSNPRYPEGVSEADIDNIGEPMDADLFDCDYQKNIVCPFCGEKETESDVVADNMRDEQTRIFQCSYCGKDSSFMVHITLTFSSFKTDGSR